MNMINAYIDSYEYITILIDKSIYNENKKFFISGEEDQKELEIINSYDDGLRYKYICKNEGFLLNKDYYITDEDDNSVMLMSGSIIREERFDAEFYYDGWLGYKYSKEFTIFRIWSPVAKEIFLCLNDGKKEEEYMLEYVDRGVWEVRIYKDLDGIRYNYLVRTFDKFIYSLDPNGIASCANSRYNYVIDKNKCYKMKYNKPEFSGEYPDAVIYEASIRDFTINAPKNPGNYLTMVDDSLKISPVKYMSYLGITHVQLLPLIDFYGVDDLKKNVKYNWGYNPVQYMVPSGWYSKNPDDAYSRINELREMIDNFHKEGIRVITDVVFNHVYDPKTFPFDILVPGYAYRINPDGSYNNASGCGNTLATERLMVRKYFLDVIKYWMEMFDVSGFRFDLMGLIDIKTLNEIKALARQIDPKCMLYGEGWNMPTTYPSSDLGIMYNYHKMDGYAFFNDRFRDVFRGSQFSRTGGFIFNDSLNLYDVLHLLLGSCLDYFKFNDPSRTINYLECHDNYTLYDYSKFVLKRDDNDALSSLRLGMQIIMISQGVPFIHAGMEVYHSKMGVENSYNSSDYINSMKFENFSNHKGDIAGLVDLVRIRKKYDVFRLKNPIDIRERIHLLEGLTNNQMISLLYQGDGYEIIAIIKNDFQSLPIDYLNAIMIFDGKKEVNKKVDSIVLEDKGVYLFLKEREN